MNRPGRQFDLDPERFLAWVVHLVLIAAGVVLVPWAVRNLTVQMAWVGAGSLFCFMIGVSLLVSDLL